MSLFESNKAFLLLSKNGLQLLTKSQEPQQLIFPPEAVKHQEIVDKRLFEKLLTDFFTQFKKFDGVLLLTEDIVFQKQLPQTVSLENLQLFYETIPFSKNLVAKKTIQTSQNTFLFATNSDLYQTIVLVAKQRLWEIKKVLPITIFIPYLQGQGISYKTLSLAIQHKEFLNLANFLNEEKLENSEKQEKITTNSITLKQYLMLFGSVLFLLGALTVGAINLNLLPFQQQKTNSIPVKNLNKSNKPTIQITSPPPTVDKQILAKKNITLYLVNGSGINGQATLLKQHLVSLGYVNIQISNEQNINSKDTIVIFSNNVNNKLKEEIVTALQSLFTQVNSQATASASTYDVSITTGEVIK
ncbi:MAG TPA: LytR C-terminal domain-containing protein [Candidatus Sulfotelmatobacter sp.]|jgi:hypothetical protein|nr:LytR C-terminal domain-containing protein [Candidatus Sulfotelmatobacter sp.]